MTIAIPRHPALALLCAALAAAVLMLAARPASAQRGGDHPNRPEAADRGGDRGADRNAGGQRESRGAPPPGAMQRSPGGARGPGGDVNHWYDGGHGLNRYYPRPGWSGAVPAPARSVYWGGAHYRYWDGVWYSPGARGYVVVRPPFGVVIDDRPAYYSLVTVGAIGYLYANGVYYREHPGGGYEVVPPPVDGVGAAPARLFVYPRQGQSAQQQSSDEYDCHRWSVSQTGYDPTGAATGQFGAPGPDQRVNYERARGACLEGRGYTVR